MAMPLQEKNITSSLKRKDFFTSAAPIIFYLDTPRGRLLDLDPEMSDTELASDISRSSGEETEVSIAFSSILSSMIQMVSLIRI